MSSLNKVRPFFRAVLKRAPLKLVESFDAFDDDNIPSGILDKTFMMIKGRTTSGSSNHQIHNFIYPLQVKVFIKGFNKPVEAVDRSDTLALAIYDELLKPSIRLGEDLKDIIPVGYDVKSLSDNDENDLILEMDFNIKLAILF